MKIQYISDIHLELLDSNTAKNIVDLILPQAEILVLAGDIGDPNKTEYTDFLVNVSKKFRKVFIIAGNHEYYGKSVNKTKQILQYVCNDLVNVSFLDNTYEDFEGFRFIGTTQWTKIHNPRYTINDIGNIINLDVNKYNLLYTECFDFLQDTLKECKEDNLKSIVITHHLPIYGLTHTKYKIRFYEKYSQWFNAELDDLIKENNNIISGWLYGHTHNRSVQTHYDVNFYCNPLGYEGENNHLNINMVCDII